MPGSAFTRRRLLRAGAVVAALGAVSPVGAARAAPLARFADDFTGVPDGLLDGRVAASGHRWRAWGVGPSATMVVEDGAVGAPADHVPGGGTTAGTAAGYATVELVDTVGRVEAEYRWDRSPSTRTGLAMGAFDFGADPAAFPARGGGANAHLAVSPAFVEFAVFSRGVNGDYTPLVPRGGASPTVRFPRPQVRDGHTTYRASITIDGDTARVEVDGLADPLVYRDPRIASVPAVHPFWEYYSSAGGTNLPRFVRVAAQHA